MQNCRNCLIIRYFLIAVLFIVLMGLVFTDKTHYLSFIKPYYAAYLVFFFGLAVFFLKLTQYYSYLYSCKVIFLLKNYSINKLNLETVKMFRSDALKANLKLK